MDEDVIDFDSDLKSPQKEPMVRRNNKVVLSAAVLLVIAIIGAALYWGKPKSKPSYASTEREIASQFSAATSTVPVQTVQSIMTQFKHSKADISSSQRAEIVRQFEESEI